MFSVLDKLRSVWELLKRIPSVLGHTRTGLGYLRRSDETMLTILIGGVLVSHAFLIVPKIVLMGYYVRVVRRVSHDEETPATFDGLRELLVDGTKAYLIWEVYVTGALLVTYLLVSRLGLDPWELTGLYLRIQPMDPGRLIEIFREGGFTSMAVNLLVFLYIYPTALANFAHRGTLRAASPVSVVFRIRRLGVAYVPSWTVFFLLSIAATTVSVALNLGSTVGIPFSGALSFVYFGLGPLVEFYLTVAAYAVLGYAWVGLSGDADTRGIAPPTQTNAEGSDSGDGVRLTRPAETTSRRGARRTERGSLRNRIRVPAWLGTDPRAWKYVLVGAFLVGYSLVPLIGMAVSGYLVRVIRSTLGGDDTLPTYEDVVDLVVDGVKAYVIWAVYALPSSILFLWILLLETGSGPGEIPLVALFGVGLPGGFIPVLATILGAVGLIPLVRSNIDILAPIVAEEVSLSLPVVTGLFLATTYLVPAALANFAESGSIRAGFDIRTVVHVVPRVAYAKCWLGIVGLTLPGWAVLSFLVTAPILGLDPGAAVVPPVLESDGVTIVEGTLSLAGWFWLLYSSVASLGYFVALVLAARLLGRTWATLT